MSGNYPPGTSASDPRAPWNQDEIEVDDDEILDYIEEELLDDLIFEEDDGRWSVESEAGEWLGGEGEAWEGAFPTQYDAEAYLFAERYSWLDERVAERKREEEIDRAYDAASGES